MRPEKQNMPRGLHFILGVGEFTKLSGVQNYMLEKAFWLWREWNRMKRLETRIQLWDCENNLGEDDNDLAEQGYWDQTKCTNAKDIQNV